MSHRPGKFARGLAAAVLALGASVALAMPALAEEGTFQFGSLVFNVTGEGTTVTEEGGVVYINGGDADITVTQAELPEGETEVWGIGVGSAMDGSDGQDVAYDGTLSLQGIDLDELSITVENSSGTSSALALEDCTFAGEAGGFAAIDIGADSDAALSLSDCTITGGSGDADSTSTTGGPAIVIGGDNEIEVSGTVTVTGGTGGESRSSSDPLLAGGAGIDAPSATLTMGSGKLLVQAGETGTGSDIQPEELPVGLTVATLNLMNATNTDGEGPEVTAIGWPTENAKPLPISGIQTGTPGNGDFYPWLIQVSTAADGSGSDPFVVGYAGSGSTEPIARQGWRWFNIAPHKIDGLALAVQSAGGMIEDALLPEVSEPAVPSEAAHLYRLVLAPSFEGTGNLTVQPVAGATFADPSFDPADSVTMVDAESNEFYVRPDAGGDVIGISCSSITLPESLEALYTGINPATMVNVPVLKPVFRLLDPNTQAHLLTASRNEWRVLTSTSTGWEDEGIAFYASPDGYGTPVYRLLNPVNGDHLWTSSPNEYNVLSERDGWIKEEVAFYGAPADAYPVWRLWNSDMTANDGFGSHLWTSDANEYNVLPKLPPVGAWHQEGISWYAAALAPATS